ncbi:MAG: hypothetical protein QXH54_06890 [Methanothermobacter sp.]
MGLIAICTGEACSEGLLTPGCMYILGNAIYNIWTGLEMMEDSVEVVEVV